MKNFSNYLREARVPNLWSDEITDQLSDQILDLEEAWNGGVADFGDKKAAYAIERAKGYKEYISLIRSKLPASFIAYRSMSEYEYDEWVNGSGVGYLSFTFEKRIANAWKKFTRRKNDKVIAAPIKKSFVIMRGKEEESEIVVDGDEISAHQIKIG